MATNSYDLFEDCTICRDQLEDPRALPCLHTFCLHCVGKLVERGFGAYFVICPLCRKRSILSRGDPNFLPKNFYIKTMNDMRTSHEADNSPFPGRHNHRGTPYNWSTGRRRQVITVLLVLLVSIGCYWLPTIFSDIKGLHDSNEVRHIQMQTARMALSKEPAVYLHTIRRANQVRGLTQLDDELFVLTENDHRIDVYNLTIFTTYYRHRHIVYPDLKHGRDITACQTLKRIYVSDSRSWKLHGFDVHGQTVLSVQLDARPAGVSVTPETNILVTYAIEGKVVEFSAAGKIVREISLQFDISHPFQAVQISSEQYVVSHGNKDDLLNRVVIVDAKGRIREKYGGPSGRGSQQLDSPTSIAVSGFILVSDFSNGRILMLSPELQYVRKVVSKLNAPSRIWFDVFSGRLYVADNTGWNEETRLLSYGVITVYSLV